MSKGRDPEQKDPSQVRVKGLGIRELVQSRVETTPEFNPGRVRAAEEVGIVLVAPARRRAFG